MPVLETKGAGMSPASSWHFPVQILHNILPTFPQHPHGTLRHVTSGTYRHTLRCRREHDMAHPTPTEYFEQIIHQQFAAGLAGAPEAADQPELTAIYEITGAGGGTYALRAAHGRVERLPDDLSVADMYTTLTIEDWRSSTESGLTDPLVDYVVRRKVAVVKSLKGL